MHSAGLSGTWHRCALVLMVYRRLHTEEKIGILLVACSDGFRGDSIIPLISSMSGYRSTFHRAHACQLVCTESGSSWVHR